MSKNRKSAAEISFDIADSVMVGGNIDEEYSDGYNEDKQERYQNMYVEDQFCEDIKLERAIKKYSALAKQESAKQEEYKQIVSWLREVEYLRRQNEELWDDYCNATQRWD